MDMTGFTFDEVDNILKDIEGSKEDDFDLDQALNEIEEPTTRPGDIWILGKNRLMCGDSTQKENVLRLMDKQCFLQIHHIMLIMKERQLML